jgi:GNAT superfamily N-acetyltransferase
MTRIRRALEGEAAALTAIAVQAKAHWGYTGAQLAAWREELTILPGTVASCPTCVAENESGLVGFFCLAPAPIHWTLEHFWVLPSAMGKGVGRALLARAAALANEGGAQAIAIDADPNAEAFYLACGARRVGALSAPLVGQAQRVRPQLLLPAAPPSGGERESG